MNTFTITSHSTTVLVIGIIIGAFTIPLTVVYGFQNLPQNFFFFAGSFLGLFIIFGILIYFLSKFKIHFTIQSTGLNITWLQRTFFRSSKNEFVRWNDIKYFSVLPTPKREGLEIDIFLNDGRKIHVASHKEVIYNFRDSLKHTLDTLPETMSEFKKPMEIDFYLTSKALYLAYFCFLLIVVFAGFLVYVEFFDAGYRSVNMPLYPFVALFGLTASVVYKVYHARKKNKNEILD